MLKDAEKELQRKEYNSAYNFMAMAEGVKSKDITQNQLITYFYIFTKLNEYKRDWQQVRIYADEALDAIGNKSHDHKEELTNLSNKSWEAIKLPAHIAHARAAAMKAAGAEFKEILGVGPNQEILIKPNPQNE